MLKCVLSSVSVSKNRFWHSKRNFAALVQSCNIINEYVTKHLNSRTIVSNERKSEPFKNIDKVSRTLIAVKYLRLVKSSVRG